MMCKTERPKRAKMHTWGVFSEFLKRREQN